MEGGVIQGFIVSYDGRSIVTVRRNVQPEAFGADVARAQRMLRQFDRSKPGSDWGCDGIGWHCQLQKGEVLVHRSGVGPRKWKEGWAKLNAPDFIA